MKCIGFRCAYLFMCNEPGKRVKNEENIGKPTKNEGKKIIHQISVCVLCFFLSFHSALKSEPHIRGACTCTACMPQQPLTPLALFTLILGFDFFFFHTQSVSVFNEIGRTCGCDL